MGLGAEKVYTVGAELLAARVLHHGNLFASNCEDEARRRLFFAEAERVDRVGEFIDEVIHTAE